MVRKLIAAARAALMFAALWAALLLALMVAMAPIHLLLDTTEVLVR